MHTLPIDSPYDLNTTSSNPTLALLPYQKETVRFWLNLPIENTGMLLADQPGVGKTPPSLQILNHYWKSVVLLPAIARGTWLYEYNRWLQRIDAQAIYSSKDKIYPETRTLIVSYQLAITDKWKKLLRKFLESASSSILICDEAHYLRNRRTQAYKTARSLSKVVDQTLLLTGTPVVTGITDLWTLCEICQPGEWGTWWDFANTYSIPYHNGFAIEYKGVNETNLPHLKERLSSFMLRRFTKDVQKDLPKKRTSRIYFDIEKLPDIRRTISTEDDLLTNAPHIATALQELGLRKITPAMTWLYNIIEQEPHRKLVIFAHHKRVVEAYKRFFDKHSITAATISGSTTPKQKQDAVDGFQDNTIQVLICNIQSAGTAITLTAGYTAIFVELVWDPIALYQAIKRLLRHGQPRMVEVFYLLANNSLDADVIDVIERKIEIIDQTVGL